MKNIVLSFVAFLFVTNFSFAQTLNWNTLSEEQKHFVNLNTAIDYGITFGAGYGYHLKAGVPLVLNVDVSIPAGKNILDDFKSKAGIQIRLYEWRNICFSAEAQGIFRRYETEYVRLLNFGSDFSGTIGYYGKHWFAAGQFGFDKAIVTQFKNSELLQDVYPGIQNGWYQPSTGGNFYYGLKGGYSFRQSDIYIEAGKVIQQDFKTSSTIPLYAQVGLSWKFPGRKE